MIVWLLIQVLVITAFIVGYLLGSRKDNGVIEKMKQLRDIIPTPQKHYKILQKKLPQTQDEKTLEEVEKQFNAESQDKK